MESIADIINKATRNVEEKIRNILQNYHYETGMIPEDIQFAVTDTSTHDKKSVIISRVDLKART